MSLYQSLTDSLAKRPSIVAAAREVFGSNVVNDNYLYGCLCRYLARRCQAQRPYGSLRINIETTLACNAKCVMCSKRSHPVKVGTMSDDLFQKIVAEAQSMRVQEAILSVYGEPLMDPQFVQRATLVDQVGIPFSFFTNGSLLKERTALELLRLKNLHRISFSINGFGKSTYEQIMVGLDRDTTYTNVQRFLQMKREMRPDLNVAITCVRMDEDEHEIGQMQAFWGRMKEVNLLYFPALRNRGGITLDVERTGGTVRLSPLAKKGHKLLPCKFLWGDLYVYWNGDVGVCCEDTAARRIIIGNANNEPLRHIWNGEKMNQLRHLHLEGKRHLHKVCGGSCTYNTVWLKP